MELGGSLSDLDGVIAGSRKPAWVIDFSEQKEMNF
jgi:hypothetical protein